MDGFSKIIAVDDHTAHYIHSVLRERIVEHVFIGDALRRFWQLGIMDVEVMRSEFDAGGYDLVMSRGKIIRHIQFKTMSFGGKTANTKIGVKLLEKPSGCVIWIVVKSDLTLDSFLWLGGEPGEQLPDISDLKVAKHTKGNAEGAKIERPNHRIVPRGKFERLNTLDQVLERLFGAFNGGEISPQIAQI